MRVTMSYCSHIVWNQHLHFEMKLACLDDSLEWSCVDNYPKEIFGYAWRRHNLVSNSGVPGQ